MDKKELLKLYIDFRKELNKDEKNFGRLFFKYFAVFADKKYADSMYFLLMIKDYKLRFRYSIYLNPLIHYFNNYIKKPIKINLSPKFIDKLVESEIMDKEQLSAALISFFDIKNLDEITNLKKLNFSQLLNKYYLTNEKMLKKAINRLKPQTIKKVALRLVGTISEEIFFILWEKTDDVEAKQFLLKHIEITPEFIEKFNSKYKIGFFEVETIINNHNIDEETINKLIDLSDNPNKIITILLYSAKIDADKKIKILIKNKDKLNDYFYNFLQPFKTNEYYKNNEQNKKTFFEFIDKYGYLINKKNWSEIFEIYNDIPMKIIDKNINNINIEDFIIQRPKIEFDFIKKHIDKISAKDLFYMIFLRKITGAKLKDILDILDDEKKEELIKQFEKSS